ncbi:phage integrase central domain-containing protein [Burkholderia theae]|uniref:phage integrase central domain-containing protein n=1 Tax=Burkholderia theae TaxID=3143496 RepID=UPI0039F63E50
MNSLETDVFPKPGNRKLDAIRRDDCADILRPIRLTKTATASCTCRRIQQSCSGPGHTGTSQRTLSRSSTGACSISIQRIYI